MHFTQILADWLHVASDLVLSPSLSEIHTPLSLRLSLSQCLLGLADKGACVCVRARV